MNLANEEIIKVLCSDKDTNDLDIILARVRTKGRYTGDYYMKFTDSDSVFQEDIDKTVGRFKEKHLIRRLNCYTCPTCDTVWYSGNYCSNCGQRVIRNLDDFIDGEFGDI